MAIDPYARCPGGTGKKIKFCCPDLLGELDELLPMIQGDQHVAALRFVERVEAKGPPRACLLAMKLRLLRLLGQHEQATATAAAFLAHFPDNPIALAESAVERAVAGELHEAVVLIQRALLTRSELEFQVYEALGIVAENLLTGGEISAARCLWELQAFAHDEDPEPFEALAGLGRSPYVPLLLKEDPTPAECPADVPWKNRFEEAMELVRKADWLAGVERLEALARDVPEAPAVWRNLALARGWLADRSGQIEAWRRFSSLGVPLEDAVEAEATAAFLMEDGLGDHVEVLRQVYPIEDADHLVAIFSTCPQAVALAAESEPSEDEEVPPKAGFYLMNRPALESAEQISRDTIPTVVGRILIYGRQTDRPARLVAVSPDPEERETFLKLIGELAGDQLAGPPETEVVGHVSASRGLLRRIWRFPAGVSHSQIQSLAAEHLAEALLERWPARGLGLLDGKTPAEAAADPKYRVKVLAAILVMQIWMRESGERFDFNRLRARLGLPVLEPIDPDLVAVEQLPLVRLDRVIADKLSDESLLAAFRRAVMCDVGEAMGRFAQVLVDRPGILPQNRASGFRALVELERNSDRALGWLERGRQMSESAKQSSASWDLMELNLRTERGELEEVKRLVEHIQRDHLEEPGVGDALLQYLVSIGVIRPDGTRASRPAVSEPPEVDAAGPGLWTPDGPAPGPPAPPAPPRQRPTIWTPGSD